MNDLAIVRMVEDPEEKRRIARQVLEDITDWFGVVESREKYIRDSADRAFFAARCGGEDAGFACLKKTGPLAAEIAVMGVKKAYHRRGLGRALVLAAKGYAADAGMRMLQVKTVEDGVWAEYDLTNKFYRSMGFEKLEVIPELWGPEDPCQIYVMTLDSVKEAIARRHSYRGNYRPEPVPREHLTAILRAGLAAPSGCNKQTTSLIAVDDPALLKRLREAVDPPIAVTAPAWICVLTRRIPAYRDKCFATQDYSAAIENMLLTITSLGYSGCWYEGHVTDDDRIGDRLAQILGVPDEYELVCVLPVGKACSPCPEPKKLPFEERAWFNGFRADAESEKEVPV